LWLSLEKITCPGFLLLSREKVGAGERSDEGASCSG